MKNFFRKTAVIAAAAIAMASVPLEAFAAYRTPEYGISSMDIDKECRIEPDNVLWVSDLGSPDNTYICLNEGGSSVRRVRSRYCVVYIESAGNSALTAKKLGLPEGILLNEYNEYSNGGFYGNEAYLANISAETDYFINCTQNEALALAELAQSWKKNGLADDVMIRSVYETECCYSLFFSIELNAPGTIEDIQGMEYASSINASEDKTSFTVIFPTDDKDVLSQLPQIIYNIREDSRVSSVDMNCINCNFIHRCFSDIAPVDFPQYLAGVTEAPKVTPPVEKPTEVNPTTSVYTSVSVVPILTSATTKKTAQSTSTAIAYPDSAPLLKYDSSPIKPDEKRDIYVLLPDGRPAEGIRVETSSSMILGRQDNVVSVTPVKEGTVSLVIYAEGFGHPAEVTFTVKNPSVTSAQEIEDDSPILGYTLTPMNVGETITVKVKSRVNKAPGELFFYNVAPNIDLKYNRGDKFFTITALYPDENDAPKLYVREDGCKGKSALNITVKGSSPASTAPRVTTTRISPVSIVPSTPPTIATTMTVVNTTTTTVSPTDPTTDPTTVTTITTFGDHICGPAPQPVSAEDIKIHVGGQTQMKLKMLERKGIANSRIAFGIPDGIQLNSITDSAGKSVPFTVTASKSEGTNVAFDMYGDVTLTVSAYKTATPGVQSLIYSGECPSDNITYIKSGGAVTILPEDSCYYSEASMYGDSNTDMSINIADVVMLNKYLLNSEESPLADIQLANSDCVKDGVINSSDSTIIMNYVSMTVYDDELGKADTEYCTVKVFATTGGDNSIVVLPVEGLENYPEAERLLVKKDYLPEGYEPAVGDILEIEYTGMINGAGLGEFSDIIGVTVINTTGINTCIAELIFVENDSIIVKPVYGSPELNSSDRFAVSLKCLPSGFKAVQGDKATFRITYKGGILECYPALFEDIVSVEVLTHEHNNSIEICAAQVLETQGSLVIVNAEDASGGDLGRFGLDKNYLPEGYAPSAGDKLKIRYKGINEIYPAQFTEIISVTAYVDGVETTKYHSDDTSVLCTCYAKVAEVNKEEFSVYVKKLTGDDDTKYFMSTVEILMTPNPPTLSVGDEVCIVCNSVSAESHTPQIVGIKSITLMPKL